jgi:hypothetical protein
MPHARVGVFTVVYNFMGTTPSQNNKYYRRFETKVSFNSSVLTTENEAANSSETENIYGLDTVICPGDYTIPNPYIKARCSVEIFAFGICLPRWEYDNVNTELAAPHRLHHVT